ncbi:heme biosynthesis HemY N-terminal domain-containing protein [Marinospirillum perlucidum]|uniref:heme biosynthesis HemY N-terminal domain-containing protein n=1 Tax=Marinospirillum perlucidum TaxID=1982602 RepID=UPI000DF29B5F|nr:heme biosynthesis HemY N-terminal domain-containing protein [Marinospirillum perlucidum]
MIKRGLLILLVLAVSVLAGQQLLQGSGYLLLVMPEGDISLEMSFWTALVLLLLSWVAAVWISTLLGWLSHPLAGLKERYQRNRAQRALNMTVKGLKDLAEGRWKKARKQLSRSAKNSGAALINYLAAAQAAHYEGREEEAEAFLKLASESTPDAGLAVDFTQARIQLDHGHYEQALATLVRLHQKVPNHPLVLRQLKEVHVALADWKPLLNLLPEFRKYRIYSTQELDLLERQVYLRRFDELLRASGSRETFQAISDLWEALPGRLKNEDELILAFSRVLVKQEKFAQAEQLIKRALRNHWSSDLVKEYGTLPVEAEPKRRLLEAEKWLQERPNDPVLLHCLARISQQLELWGKALEYYQTSQRLAPSDAINAEISRLYAALGDERKSQYFNQLALQGLHRQLPDLPLPKPGR